MSDAECAPLPARRPSVFQVCVTVGGLASACSEMFVASGAAAIAALRSGVERHRCTRGHANHVLHHERPCGGRLSGEATTASLIALAADYDRGRGGIGRYRHHG